MKKYPTIFQNVGVAVTLKWEWQKVFWQIDRNGRNLFMGVAVFGDLWMWQHESTNLRCGIVSENLQD